MKIAVVSFKGGVGKSTTAVHLAGLFAKKGKTVLIDGDQNRSSLEWVERGFFNFDVVDSNKLGEVRKTHEHLIFDTKARPDDEDLNVLIKGCDLFVVPTTPDALSIKANQKLLESIGKRKIDLRVLITMVPPPPSHDGADAYKFMKKLGLKVFKSQIRRFQAYKKASLAGCLVSQVKNPYSRIASSDYEKVVKEILR